MSASQFLSKHIPGLASGVQSVLGTADVQTGLKEITSATANLKTQAQVLNEEAKVHVDWGGSLDQGVIRLSVFKSGTINGATVGDTAVDVSFLAHGDR